MKRNVSIVVVLVIMIVVAAAAGLYLTTRNPGPTGTTESTGGVVRVVAAENFWGSLASQLGGSRVNVTSIVSDPNADPHEYSSSPSDARAVANANLVIVNGAGYDTWANDILSAGSTPNQRVLDVQQLIKASQDANPHFWYSPFYVNDTVKGIYNDLVAIDPSDTSYFRQQYSAMNQSLWQSYMSREAATRQQYGGVPVAATEDIFVYMANATGLSLVSPPGFMQAVAEGNDPSAQDVATFQQLMNGGNGTVHVLVYNQQTVTPLAQSIKSLATQNHIPTVGVTETIQPPDITFQNWMQSEVIGLQSGLGR